MHPHMETSTSTAAFWKRKLAAFLHDPPTKCLDIPEHREKSVSAMIRAGFDEEWVGKYDHEADHTAAAADRVPFPLSRASGLTCVFDGVRARFHHPLDGRQQIAFPRAIESDQLGTEIEQHAQPGDLPFDAALGNTDDAWRARFFAHWRLWQRNAVDRDWRLGFLPADTRIPDHTIWSHMQIVSALAGCELGRGGNAAFLRVQLGGVQEFIAQARNIRDLWSGSYLFSWLMAAGLKALSAQVGADAVIFPNLCGQPLFDLLWRKELWSRLQHQGAKKNVWENFEHTPEAIFTPNLPNVFLAVVPATDGARLGMLVKDAIDCEWMKIAAAVWKFCDEAGNGSLTADEGALTRILRRDRFFSQLKSFLAISWQVQPWEADLERAKALAQHAPADSPLAAAVERVSMLRDMAERALPAECRDSRNYVRDADDKVAVDASGCATLSNVGAAWSIFVAHQQSLLEAVRQTRGFAAAVSTGTVPGTANSKDALNGRDEAVAGGREWAARCRILGHPWATLFKKNDWVGAITLVKRTWHLAYLAHPEEKGGWGFKPDDFRMPNTRGVAAHEPLSNLDDEDDPEDIPASEKHYAILALDGDEIGKWVSGAKTPPYENQLAGYSDHTGAVPQGSLPHFKRLEHGRFAASRRALSPSYHLQFSEALSNFALHCARPIVEAFDGRLIYAGGDDVLAILPADSALVCAQALRMTFQGNVGLGEFLRAPARRLAAQHERRAEQEQRSTAIPHFQRLAAEGCLFAGDRLAPGFLARADWRDDFGDGKPIPFIVPGSSADCSVGIAMARFKAPLQDVVRAAQAAEKRAKTNLGRSAVAVTLFKGSGEILEWGANWDGGGLDFHAAIGAALDAGQLSGKFPHRLCELFEPFISRTSKETGQLGGPIQDAPGFDAAQVIRSEFARCLHQHEDKKNPPDRKQLLGLLDTYLASLQGKHASQIVESLTGLLAAVAFAHRTRPETTSAPKGTTP